MSKLDFTIFALPAAGERLATHGARLRLLPGLALSVALALSAIALGKLPWPQAHGMSALTVAIALGMVLGNTVFARLAPFFGAGAIFSKHTVLRLGVILYGVRLTFQDIGQVGMAGVAIDALVLTSTFGLAVVLGTRLFKLDRDMAILIGVGSAICGAAAVMAAQPVVRAKTEQLTVALSTVVIFGTVATFLYPLLYGLSLRWHMLATSPTHFGIYIGSTIHEVAQVVAAARSINENAANAAVIAKMVRVMMLAPFLVLLSAYLRRPDATGATPGLTPQQAMPWFAFAFIGVVGLNSFAIFPPGMVADAIELDTLLLATAMASLGLTTQISSLRRAGLKPMLLATLLFVWLIMGGAAINGALDAMLG